MTNPVEIPIDGILDLHTFKPSEVPVLVKDYLELCHERGIIQVRIIHGKGKGVLRATVRNILGTHPLVAGYHDAPDSSGWGATIVHLRSPKKSSPQPGVRNTV
ncbi:MAG: DNA mismatch repair protein MutS [Deltaproteobacteria bacterium]|nr:MAG: DNA mismatch repair protein MutS [Deltaproteobacteria bacterium]